MYIAGLLNEKGADYLITNKYHAILNSGTQLT